MSTQTTEVTTRYGNDRPVRESNGTAFSIESVGTAVLCFFGFLLIDHGIPTQPWTRYSVAIAFGLAALVFGVVASKRGFDWHGNPYVTMVKFGGGEVDGGEALVRISGQFVGTAIAALIVWPPWSEYHEIVNAVPTPAPGVPYNLVVWASLAVGATIGVAALLSTRISIIGPLLIPLAVYLGVYYGWNLEGGGANAARNVVPMILSGKFVLTPLFWELVGAAIVMAIAFVISRNRGTSSRLA